MAPGDHLSATVEAVEELPISLAEFALGGVGPHRDEPRRPVADAVEHVGTRGT